MSSASELKVDWPRCVGRGLCHELLPELIDLDPWGYPIIPATLPAHYRAAAREAVRECPKLALRIVERGTGL